MNTPKQKLLGACPICKQTPCRCGYMTYYKSKGDGLAVQEKLSVPQSSPEEDPPMKAAPVKKKRRKKD